jgi:hypothetical protein
MKNSKITLLSVLYFTSFIFLCAFVKDSEQFFNSLLTKDGGFFLIILTVALGIITFFGQNKLKNTPLLGSNGPAFVVILCATLLSYVYLWSFDLDDKWVYYRISKIVLSTGLPLWNANESVFVGASYLYPYFLAPGHFFGNWDAWELYEKFFGALTHLFGAFLVYLSLRRNKPFALICSGAVALFMPSLLWSLGGLETSLAACILLIGMYFYFRNGWECLYFWVLCGFLMWIRPDAILMGVGAYSIFFIGNIKNIRLIFTRGLAFATPILIYFFTNWFYSGKILPNVFYVKGWNKAFSGKYPLYYDAFIGGTHFISAIFTSYVFTFGIIAAAVVFIRINFLSDNSKAIFLIFPNQKK